MVDSGSEAKTEEASPRKLRLARERGEVATSVDLNRALLLFVAIAALSYQSALMGGRLLDICNQCFELSLQQDISKAKILEIGAMAFQEGASSLLMLLVLLASFSFAIPFLQVGPLFTLGPLQLKFERLGLIAGFRRTLFESNTYIEFLKLCCKATIIGLVAWTLVRGHLSQLLSMVSKSPLEAAQTTFMVLGECASWVALIFLMIGIVDFFWQRFCFAKRMRMSRKELLDEYKEEEGDPLIKGLRQQLHQEI